MKRLFLTLSLVLASFALAAPAFAGNSGSAPTTTITKSSRHDNKVFVGINWNFGVRTGATAVVGYRWAQVSTSDHVHGVLVDLTVPLTGAPVQLGEFHVKGLDGTRSVQGELGVGYGFQGEAFLVNGGVRVPYVNAGTDYLFGKGWQPYVGIDTLQRARPHTETTQTSCTPPAILSGGLCILPPPPGAG